jgi:PiT family inorganic phosphate transporter
MIVLVGLLLAYANGANDNFKGVATLLGSGTTDYRRALFFATAATVLGSLSALLLARGLLAAFSGEDLVPPEVVQDPAFAAGVALAAGLTVLSATLFGLPISTTHALIGALVGAGLVASSTGIDRSKLTHGFLLPLLTSPIIAIALTAVVYPILRSARARLGVTRETCLCVGETVLAVIPGSAAREQLMQTVSMPTLTVASQASCQVRYRGSVLGVNVRPILNAAHYFSAAAVCFARGLNDTPKIAALLLVGGLVGSHAAIAGVALAMALGGILSASRVARTMAHRVTEMNPGQGFTANLITAFLVIGASRFGMPVSTTHVSCGSLFGIGSITRQAHWKTIGNILMAWLITAPIAGLLGAAFAWVLRAE